MSLTIQISDKSAELLAEQAAEHGLSLEAWIEELAVQKSRDAKRVAARSKARKAVEGILQLQKHVKPDPEGWTVKDYIEHGRR